MMKAYAVFDAKAAAYGLPMFVPTSGLAIRGFSDACKDKQSPLFQHPSDYSLYELGEYDRNSGLLTPCEKPVFVCSASEFVQKEIKQEVL